MGSGIQAPFVQMKTDIGNIKTAFSNGILNSVNVIQTALNEVFTTQT